MRAALLSALVTLAAAAPADAVVTELRVFKVTAEGTGTYERHDRVPGPNGTITTDVGTTFGWRTIFPRVMFDNDGNPFGFPTNASDGSTNGTGTEIDVTPLHDSPPQRKTCTASETPMPNRGTLERGGPPGPPGEEGLSLRVSPLDLFVRLSAFCTGDPAGSIEIWGRGPSPFEHTLFVPTLALNQGKVIQHVPQPDHLKTFERCPGRIEHSTVDCALRWEAKVTFELVERIPVAPLVDEQVPLPRLAPPAPAPAPAPDAAPAVALPRPTPCTTDRCRHRAALKACERGPRRTRKACVRRANRALATAKCRSRKGRKARAKCVRRLGR